MTKYVLEDRFEFVTDSTNMIVATKYPGKDSYNTEKDFGIYVIGSTPKISISPTLNVSNPPKIGEHLLIRGENAPPSVSPTKIVTIDDHFPK